MRNSMICRICDRPHPQVIHPGLEPGDRSRAHLACRIANQVQWMEDRDGEA